MTKYYCSVHNFIGDERCQRCLAERNRFRANDTSSNALPAASAAPGMMKLLDRLEELERRVDVLEHRTICSE